MRALSPDLCRAVVTASLTHLCSHIEGDGFLYVHEAGNPQNNLKAGYNLLRHCGTLWFVMRAVNDLRLIPDADLTLAMSKTLSRIGRRLVATPWAAPGRPSLALVSKGQVKLGGVGLALLAMAEALKIQSLNPLAEGVLPHALPQTIALLRQYALDEIDGGDFRHVRDFATGAVTDFRSSFFTGEAIFGLLMTGAATDDLSRITKGLLKQGYGWMEQSHWMAYAACEAVERDVVSDTLGSAYLSGLMQMILGDTRYRDPRESTPIACRTEALTRVLLLDRARPGLFNPALLDQVRAHAEENLRLQLHWYADGQFWKGDDSRRVQIDTIQHNATGFLHWLRLAERA